MISFYIFLFGFLCFCFFYLQNEVTISSKYFKTIKSVSCHFRFPECLGNFWKFACAFSCPFLLGDLGLLVIHHPTLSDLYTHLLFLFVSSALTHMTPPTLLSCEVGTVASLVFFGVIDYVLRVVVKAPLPWTG